MTTKQYGNKSINSETITESQERLLGFMFTQNNLSRTLILIFL